MLNSLNANSLYFTSNIVEQNKIEYIIHKFIEFLHEDLYVIRNSFKDVVELRKFLWKIEIIDQKFGYQFKYVLDSNESSLKG